MLRKTLDLLVKLFMALLFCNAMFISGGAIADDTADAARQGRDAFQQGAYRQAVQYWESALARAGTGQKIDLSIQLAEAYQSLGDHAAAADLLQQALPLAKEHGTPEQKTLLLSSLGDVFTARRRPETAKTYLDEAVTIARTLDDPPVTANALNNLGNVLYIQEAYARAQTVYAEAAELAETIEQPDGKKLLVRILSNRARASLKQNDRQQEAAELTKKALSLVRLRADSHAKAFQLLTLGELALRTRFPENLIHGIFNEALVLAEKYGDKRLMAQAKGALGQVYENAGRQREALQLTREAVFLSQEMPDLLYYWEWQRGRLLQARGDLSGAGGAYRRALGFLRKIRAQLTEGRRDALSAFYEEIRPVYFSLADVLLQQAETSGTPEGKAALLHQARDTVEQLKAAELQDYFQDDCVSRARTAKLDHLDKRTAVLYPILLPDRIALLLSLPDGIHQMTVQVTADTLNQTALKFQENLQLGAEWSFMRQAAQLYRWLIAPHRAALRAHEIDTLVIVPDASLRMIPMAALLDVKAKKFLIEEFAIATTPGLNLTDPRPLPRKNIRVLLNGLAEGVQGFAPLPNVPGEIKAIHALFGQGAAVLLDRAFSYKNLNQTLQTTPYSIVHVASHGSFDRDPNKTFLLTHDDKLTMDRLQRLLAFSQYRAKPVELLTLSACQTAAGDERAALGLAGIAIKAGARSALASLWFVNDESTSQLVTEFYRQLQNSALSKAKALRNAQLKLMKQQQTRHPLFWAPFLLIGNWL
ncbi:MAG: CHAT domain-containing protein [Gammaproteobacteria bacterium]|nr:CHAT domain-containing protein [Gammaproteobacteria bacterium]